MRSSVTAHIGSRACGISLFIVSQTALGFVRFADQNPTSDSFFLEQIWTINMALHIGVAYLQMVDLAKIFSFATYVWHYEKLNASLNLSHFWLISLFFLIKFGMVF